LVDDILPPAPPGAERASSGQKTGLFSRLFKKKVPEQSVSFNQVLPDEPPKIESSPKELGVDEPGKITPETLDDIRKQLGLTANVEIPEPPKIEPEKEEKPVMPSADKLNFTQELDEPPKIVKPKDVKEDKLAKKLSDDKPIKPAKGAAVSDWAGEVKSGASAKKSGFDVEVTPKIEQQGSKPKPEFLREVEDHEAKAVTKGLERKAFEDKRNIQYEPDIMFEEYFGRPRRAKQMLEKSDEDVEKPKHKLSKKELKALKQKELKEKKELKALKLKQMKEEKKKALLLKKEAKKPAPVIQDKPHDFTAEPVLAKPEVEEEVKPELELKGPEEEKLLPAPETSIPVVEEEPVPAPALTPIAPAIDMDKLKDKMREELKDEIRNNLKSKMKDKIREEIHDEERALLRKEYSKKDKELEALKDALTKERQALEQEKITTAGLENRYKFKEKQLVKEKELLAEEHASLKKERKQFEEEKNESESLHKKLPLMRKDYERLSEKMVAFGEQVKLNMKLDENLKHREEELAEAQKRLEETEARIKEQGFSDYLQTELKGQSMVSTKLEEGDVLHDKHLALYNMIDECKSLAFQKKIDEAKAAYMRIRDEYKKGKFREEEKDVIYTTIRELYDDINLAAINP